MNDLIMTVIGGGSVNWMRGIMRDIYLLDDFHGGEIRLVDPNFEHVEAVRAMLEAFNRQRSRRYRVGVVADRRQALRGAQLVIGTYSPGAMDAFWNDLELPIRYGVRLPVSMTVGPSGISAALRTAPVAEEIIQDMEECCPGAWFLNLTNPMSVVTRAMCRAARTVKVLGMCHGFHDFQHIVGPMLGLPRPAGMGVLDYLYRWLPGQGLDYAVAGLNHFIFLTKAELRGRDQLPVVRDFCRRRHHLSDTEADPAAQQATSTFSSTWAVAFAVCRQAGYLPINADRHTVEFIPSLCNPHNGFGMAYGVLKTTVDARRLAKVHQLEEIRRIASGEQPVGWTTSGEEMAEIIRAIFTGKSVRGIVNVPNQGQIANLPRDVIVETLGTISGDGIVPDQVGDLPGAVGTWCRLHADVQELTLRAALEGDRDLLIQALTLDPLTAGMDLAAIPSLAADLVNANRAWLPRFFR